MYHLLPKKVIIFILASILVVPSLSVFAYTPSGNVIMNTQANIAPNLGANVDVTAADIGVTSESQVNAAISESTKEETKSGKLIEIGNTTAPQTTIIVRTTDDQGNTEDVTLEVAANTSVQSDSGARTNLSEWIAGDPITFTATQYTNSGALVATRIRNRAFKPGHTGINGWVKAIHIDQNTMDVEWGAQIYTLNTLNAKLVAGIKNPAMLADFQVGDRIRARVQDDGDQNPATWNAAIVVVLRRGNTLFMRVTRWVVEGKITDIAENPSIPTTMEVEVLNSKFYQPGDVNNLIGAPGTKLKVDITADTKLVRRFLGRALLNEFSEGDTVRIIGRLNESDGHLTAKFIKNASIQRLGVAHRLGRVKSIDANARTFIVTLLHTDRSDTEWTVHVDVDTKFYFRDQTAVFGDVQIGDALRVRGTANRVQKWVDADVVSIVRR